MLASNAAPAAPPRTYRAGITPHAVFLEAIRRMAPSFFSHPARMAEESHLARRAFRW